ncbi:MAG: TIGR01841 family phasin [Alphaproteobacteria bacterium]
MTAKSTKQDKATPNNAETIMAAGQETMRNFAKTGTENFEKAFSGFRGKAEDLANGYGDMASSGKEGLEAWNAAGAAYGKGLEIMGGEMMSFAKQMLESNVTAAKAVLGAKSLNEVMELNTDFARSSFDGMMAQGTKMGEMATKAAQETAEPLNAQFTATVEKLRQNAA